MKLTDSQQAAITHRGSHLFLAASAGSGKTEVLARRVADLIADSQRPCEVGRLLVVTFTRAAAAELRVRTARMLREAAATCAEPGLRAHLRRQEVLIDSADICTIDAWCGRLVREHFAEAGVDPAFAVMSAEEARLLRVAVRRRLFEIVYRPPRADSDGAFGSEQAESDARLAADVAAWLGRHRDPEDRFLADMVEELSTFREQLVNPVAWLANEATRLVGDETAQRSASQALLAAALAGECDFQMQQLGAAASTAGTGVLAALDNYRKAFSEWRAQLVAPAALSDVVAAIAKFKPPKPARDASAADAALLDEIRTRWFEKRLKKRWVAAQIERIIAEAPQAATLVRTLLRFEARYAELLTDEKQRRAAYEFGDVQRMALDLLGTPAAGQQRTPTGIAVALRQRYEFVLVDEFQDTSPVQVELLRLVARDGPGDGNSFYVGDLKQSIYGFRQAEPRLFAGLMDAAKAEPARGRVQYLSDNFRSHAALLSGLNRLFAMLLSRELGGTEFAADEHLAAGRTETPNRAFDADPRISVQVLEEEPARRTADESTDADSDEDDDFQIEKIEREAALAAGQIRSLLAGGCQIPERGADDGVRLRPLRASDVVILLRAAAVNAGRVATVLRNHGIACVTQGRESLFDEIVVQDVRSVLALLANRRRELEMAAYLRGPMVGLTPQELHSIRLALPQAHFAWCVEHYAEHADDSALRQKVRRALERLDRWRRLSREEDLPAFLRRLLRESDLLLIAQGMPAGAQRVAQLRGLCRRRSARRGRVC